MPISFEIALPIEKHANDVMAFRNDPETMQMSFHQEKKTWPDFFQEYTEEYFSLSELPPLFAVENGKKIALIRFRPAENPLQANRKCCEISLAIAKEMRGKGHGKTVLDTLKSWLLRQGIEDVYAEIKPENAASIKTFERAGYQLIGTAEKNLEESGEKIPIRRYLLALKEDKKQEGVFIIAEAGSNWRMGTMNRDRAMGFKLIELAKEAQADAIKFQTYRPETVYVSNAGKSGYLSKSGIVEDIQEIFHDLAMPYELILAFKNHAEQCGIEFMSTAFSKQDFLAVDPHVKRHKIASYEIGHIRLLELAAKSQKPLFLSTGAATEEEITWAVRTYRALKGQDLTLLQCTAQYPADENSMNLRTIPWMMHRFQVPVGLSDHSRDPIAAPAAAAALGAAVIEKHFTLSNALPGPDHAFAITPKELKEMVKVVRSVYQMAGSGVKYPQDSETELRQFARRGIQAIKDIQPGEKLQEGINIDILRPGKQAIGLHPKNIPDMEGKIAKRFIPLGKGLDRNDY